MRKSLRLAASSLSFAASVLLIALWVRSFWWKDEVLNASNSPHQVIQSASCKGWVHLYYGPSKISRKDGWRFFATPVPNVVEWPRLNLPPGRLVFVPHGFIAAVCVVVAVAPWIRRFSLRSLLVAMTLIACLLCLAIATD